MNLSVWAGEVLAVTGPSGSGKSSLLYCLAGILRPDPGVVRFDDIALATLDDRSLSMLRAREFGFVFQFGELVPELTIRENVELPLRLNGMSVGAARRDAAEVLDRLGIGTLGTDRPNEVSGGEAQRAAVGRALVHRPRVVFADEPTGSLDGDTAAVVLDQLVDLVRDRRSALVLVTHAEEVAAVAERQVRVRDGTVQEVERQP